jgi:transcription elongation GreA/GreB family factor
MRRLDAIKTYKELQEAKQRIKQLEDRIHRAAIAFFRDGSDGQIASGMLVILEEERKKP